MTTMKRISKKIGLEMFHKIIDNVIKWRYLLAIICLIGGVAFNLNGSSLNSWNSSFGLRESVSGKKISSVTVDDLIGLEKLSLWIPKLRSDGTIFGTSRGIRSDEWLVQTPFYISQADTGNNLVNETYETSGQNMVLAYNVTTLHPSIIGKPFNWGFLVLGASRGLSWYWTFKIIAMLLLSFEFAMILTRKNKILSLISSFWITYTPVVQWWFMRHLGDIVFDSMLIMVAMYHYFNSEKRYIKVLNVCLLVIGLIGFPLVFYPAFQIPFAYVILLFTIVQFVTAYKQKKIKKGDVMAIAVTLLVSASVVGLTVFQSWDAIKLTLGTVYPGSRFSTGGEYTLANISDFLLNIKLPFETPSTSNQVELSSSYHFLYFIILVFPFIFNKKDLKKNIFELLLIIFSIFLIFYSIVGVPSIVSKLTLFNLVTSNRAWQAMSVIAVFISIWFINYVFEKKEKISFYRYFVPIFVISIFLLYRVLTDDFYRNYVGRLILIVSILILIFSFILILHQKHILVCWVVFILTFVSGFTVNPLVHGIDAIEDKALSAEVKKIVADDKNAMWMSESTNLYNFVQMFGAKSIDGVRFYPDKELMSVIDENNDFEDIWNRYSHLSYTLTNDETTMNNPTPDSTHINLNMDLLRELNISYILTKRNLEEEFGSQFQLIYCDSDGNLIFKVNE